MELSHTGCREHAKRLPKTVQRYTSSGTQCLPAMPSSATPTDSTPPGRYHVARYGNTRNFALYEGKNLLAVTMYRKGAEAVQRELETRDTVIAEQAARIEQLTAAIPPAAEQLTPPARRFWDRVRHGREEQLGFFSSEQKEQFTAARRGSPKGRA
jgi:hypothetical protein